MTVFVRYVRLHALMPDGSVLCGLPREFLGVVEEEKSFAHDGLDLAACTIKESKKVNCMLCMSKITSMRLLIEKSETPEVVEEPSKPRAAACQMCGYSLKPFDPNDTSTWRKDDFCSARCKKKAAKHRYSQRSER